MVDATWRPLGVDTEEEIAAYDALHDGVRDWMSDAYWDWVLHSIRLWTTYSDGSGRLAALRVVLTEEMCQELRIPLKSLRVERRDLDYSSGAWQLNEAMKALKGHAAPLQVADYLLAHGEKVEPDVLEAVLTRTKSAWTVGERLGRPGLVRRVPEGVQAAVDDVMTRAGQAGIRLAKAWEELYGLSPDASRAYGLAVKAVEDAAIPVVSSTNAKATLGTVIAQMEQQGDWSLPLDREHGNAPSGETVIAMMRILWHGQFDRHGGQPLQPGDVSFEEAQIAVGLAVTLVSWFDAKLPTRMP